MLGSFTGLALPIGTIVLAVATSLLVVGVLFAASTLRETRKAAQLSAAVDLLREYRSPAMQLARAAIHELPACDPKKGLEQLDASNRKGFELVSHYLDNIGSLVAAELLEPEPAAAFLGGSALLMWRDLAPYIFAERRVNRRPTYQRHFEHLVFVFQFIPFEEDLEYLGRMPVA